MATGPEAVNRQPRTPAEFLARVSQLAREGRDRDLLQLAGECGEEFHGQFTAEELNRLDGIFEGAHMVVDLQEWAAGSLTHEGSSDHRTADGEASPNVPWNRRLAAGARAQPD